ncbi:MAG: acylpyruvate hydrolase [Pseudonocardiales bacterium]|nr:acylpyruvate hydrolase [Pseudonocardiales bacterium]
MKLVTVRTADGLSAGRVEGEDIVLLDAPDVRALLDAQAAGGSVAESGIAVALAAADLAPLVPSPRKIICVGLNYRNHILEMGRELPEAPTLFAKFDRSLIGPRDDIRLPPESSRVDWEVELTAVIGRSVRRAGPDEARAAIAGWTVANDISMREWQKRTLQWLQGKTFEASTPVGPWLVTADELDASDLAVTCEVNGAVMQTSRTSELVFDPVELVSYISTIITLDPGDLILTGTPGGVGDARTPPVFLQAGDVVRTTVEGIGSLLNSCVAESAH